MKITDFLNEADQVKAKEKKPKKIKPNKGNESPHPMRGRLVGESKPQKQKPYDPNKNQPNPVAKHSRNKSGAGSHKSAKDYDRKNKQSDIRSQMDEGTYVADRMEIIDYILKEIKKEAYNDIGMIKHLADMIGKKVSVRYHKHKKEGGVLQLEMYDGNIPFNKCPQCEGEIVHIDEAEGKKDACYHKVKSRYKVWPSAYASGALVQCRKKGAKNWGNSKKK
jgi:predicted Zn-ribbon and HTH transcriptional regulator